MNRQTPPSDRSGDELDVDGIRWLTPEEAREIHDATLLPGNIAGEDGARPVESSLARVEQRVHYGELPVDVLRIGVAYVATIAKAHAFVDGNKRTAVVGMEFFLGLHGYELTGIDPEALADVVEAVAGDRMNEGELHAWLLPYLGVVTDDPSGVIVVEDGRSGKVK